MTFKLFESPTWPERPNCLELMELAMAVLHAYGHSQARMPGFAAMMGCDDAKIFESPDPLLPDVAYYSTPEGIVVAAAGTTAAEQTWHQLIYSRLVDDEAHGGKTSSAWKWAYEQMAVAAPEKYVFSGQGRRLIVTGHSFGAVMATLAAIDLQQIYPPSDILLVTFGSPKPGYWLNFPFTGTHWNVLNPYDMIQFFPLADQSNLTVTAGAFFASTDWDRFRHYGQIYRPTHAWPMGNQISYGNSGLSEHPSNHALSTRESYFDILGAALLWSFYAGLGTPWSLIYFLINEEARHRAHIMQAHWVQSYILAFERACARLPGYRHLRRFQDLKSYFHGGVWIPDRPPPLPPPQPGTKEEDFLVINVPPVDQQQPDWFGNWFGLFEADPAAQAGPETALFGGSISFTQQGENVANLFRGRDRRILEKAMQALSWIQDRDDLIRQGARSQTLSNREEVFPIEVVGLQEAYATIEERLLELLEAQRDS